MSARVALRTGVPLFASLLVIAACGDDYMRPPHPTSRTDAGPRRDGGLPRDGGLQVASGTWEDACIRWHQADCAKFESCFGRPGTGCDDTDDEIRASCRADALEDGCERPRSSSFDSCAARVAGQTCEEYCDSEFCFSFCFYSCD